MSAPLKLTADQLEEIAAALRVLSKLRRERNVDIGGYSHPEVRHLGSDTVLELQWDEDEGEYRIDDRVGS